MPAADFPDHAHAPSRRQYAVTPSDTTDLPKGDCKALWVASAGTVTLLGVDNAVGEQVSLGSLSVGTLIPVRARRVMATGTTATVVALY